MDGETVISRSGERRGSWMWSAGAAILSGGLMACCFEPFKIHGVAWISLVPWFVVMSRVSAGGAWLYGTLLGVIFYRLSLGWLVDMAGPVGIAVVVVFAIWMGLAFRVARLLADRFGPTMLWWALPLAFVGQEVLRCEGLSRYRFSYAGFGYSQSPDAWCARIVAAGGIYALSLFVVGVNAAVAYSLVQRRRRAWLPLIGVVSAGLCLVGIERLCRPTTRATVAVACVQGEEETYRQLADLTERAIKDPLRPRFIVLPEHTIGEYASEKHLFVRMLAPLAREYGVYVCVGAHVRASRSAACDYDNVALLIGPDGRIVGEQPKVVPLPFFHDGNPARAQRIFDTPYGRMGTYVCYDGDFTDVPRRLAGLGAELTLVPVMNPAKWGYAQRDQQARMARFRAMELNRAAVRAASSGTSQIIDADGRVVAERSRAEGPGIICGRVAASDGKTLFARDGHLLATAIGLGYLACLAVLTLANWSACLRRISYGLRGRVQKQAPA